MVSGKNLCCCLFGLTAHIKNSHRKAADESAGTATRLYSDLIAQNINNHARNKNQM